MVRFDFEKGACAISTPACTMNNDLSSSLFLEFLRQRGLYSDIQSVSPGASTSPTLPPLHVFQNLRQGHPESPSQRSKTFNLPFSNPAELAVVDRGSEFKSGQSSTESSTDTFQAPRPYSSLSNQQLPYFCSGPASQDTFAIPAVSTQHLHLTHSNQVKGVHAIPSERILALPSRARDALLPPEDPAASFRSTATMPSQDNSDLSLQLPASSQRDDRAEIERIITLPDRSPEKADEDRPFPLPINPAVPLDKEIGKREMSTLDNGTSTGLNECSLCPKSFKRKHDLRRHVAVYHQNVSRVFFSRFLLFIHCLTIKRPTDSFRDRILAVQQKKSFVCEKCGSTFGMSSTLDRHRASRHNLPAAVCSLCGQTFAKRSQKTHHVCHRRDPGPS